MNKLSKITKTGKLIKTGKSIKNKTWKLTKTYITACGQE